MRFESRATAAAFKLGLICPPVPLYVVCVKGCVWQFWYLPKAHFCSVLLQA